MKRALVIMFAIVMLAGLSDAAVTSKSVTISPCPGVTQTLDLDLISATAVAGIQGQINFDSSLFSNMQVTAGLGAPSFVVMGNLVAPGQYRFIAYANPTKSMTLTYPVLRFQFVAASSLPQTGSRTMTYTYEAASTTDGQSITSNFSDVNILFRRNSIENTWAIYQ
ncbi:hypothetical protein LLG95_12125 [bacterium]|nr:hypothetical protein [bacterium]